MRGCQRTAWFYLCCGAISGAVACGDPATGANSGAVLDRDASTADASTPEAALRETADGFELDTADDGVSFVVEGAAVYLSRGDERTLVLEPAGFERGSRTHEHRTGSMRQRGSRVAIERGEHVEEWYEPRERGLEQGWTIARRFGDGREPLRIVLRLGPEVGVAAPSPTREPAADGPAANENEEALVLMVGGMPVTYSGLAVGDAAGRLLPSQLRLVDGAVVLEIDDSRATYPVTVDPLIALAATTVPSGGGTYDWGTASSVDGNNLFIGQRDGVDSGYIQGRVQQYSWNGTGWTFVRTIRIAGSGSSAAFGTAVAVHGDWLVVGAPYQGTKGTVYAIRLSGGFNGSGVPTVYRALVPTETVTTFGITVSISGSRLAAGTGASNRAYVYNRTGDDWATTTANKLTGTGRFGTSVALDRQNTNLLVVSAPTQSTDGIVHIHQWTGTSWGTSIQFAPQYDDQSAYGASVAVDGGRVAIACLAAWSGRAEMVRAYHNGSAWTQSSMFFSTGYISTSQPFAFNDPNRSPSAAIARDPFLGGNDVLVLGLPNGVQAADGSGLVEGTVDVRPSTIAAASRNTFGFVQRNRGRTVATDGRRVILGYLGYAACNPICQYRGFAAAHDLRRQNGDVCTSNDQCESNYCVDGVCCNNACGGGAGDDCLACNTAQTGLANGTCGNRLAGLVCRSVSGVCDVAETCTGTSGACPANAVRPSTYECRAPAAACDAPENCDGTAVACPADALRPQGHVCRGVAGACDVSETCDGASLGCPADGYLPPDTTCRAPNPGTPCDVMEVCSGSGAACPADQLPISCETSSIGNAYGGSTLNPPALVADGDFADSVAFLYEGATPYQHLPGGGPLAAGTIEPERASSIYGYVYDTDGDPIAGAQVRILHHAELGLVPTRDNGRYDIVVNGGGMLTVQIDLPGHLTVQRTVGTEWNDSYHVADVVLTPLDNCGAPAGLDACAAIPQNSGVIQVVQGSPVDDTDGMRQATLMIPAGTTAHVEDPVLGSVPLPSAITIRATEFTVGTRGPNAMPGDLPLATAYNYAVELSVDEANGGRVVFEDAGNQPRPISLYVENFTNLPTGTEVPLGYYDRDAAAWVGAEGGRVIEILSVATGIATVDIDGDGAAEGDAELDAIGLTSGEREQLADRYAVGTRLWRVRIDHFTPWDCNWPYGPPDDANTPSVAADGDTAGGDCEYTGSIIRCENQTLGEAIPIAGTDLALRYSSNTVPGRLDAFRVRARINVLPQGTSYLYTSVGVYVAGRAVTYNYRPPPTEFQWEWDGLDGYGRRVSNRVSAVVLVCNHYRPQRGATGNFARFSSTAIAGTGRDGSPLRLCDMQVVPVGVPNHGQDAFFGWQIDALARQHFAGRLGRGQGLVSWGDGTQVDVPMSGGMVDTLVNEYGTVLRDAPGARLIPDTYLPPDSPGTWWAPTALAHAEDGSVFVGYRTTTNENPYCNAFNRIVRISSSRVEVVAGAPCPDQCGPGSNCNAGLLTEMLAEEGAPAAQVTLGEVRGLELAPDGSLLILEQGGYVRRVLPDGTIRRVAGIEPNSVASTGDDGPALEARISQPSDIAVGPDGTIYVLEDDVAAHPAAIRQIGTDGVISMVLEKGSGASPACYGQPDCHVCHRDTWPAGDSITNATFTAIDVSPTGAIYLAVRKGGGAGGCLVELLPDRSLRRVTGFGLADPASDGDGDLASAFHPTEIGAIQAGRDVIYLRTRLDEYPYRYAIHAVRNGTVDQLAIEGNGIALTVVQQMADAIVRSGLNHTTERGRFAGTFALSPRGEIAVATVKSNLTGIQRIYPQRTSDIRSGELTLEFDGPRHLATRHTTTGTILTTFERANGWLTGIVDADGNRVTVERGTGYVRFVPPFGPATRIEDEDADGWADRIEYEDAASRSYVLGTDADGLLDSIQMPDGRVHQFFYDELGRLVRDEQPGGRIATLVRNPTVLDAEARRVTHSVTYRSPSGRTTGHVSSFSTSFSPAASGEMTRTLTFPDGTTSTVSVHPRRAIEPSDNLPGVAVRQTDRTAPDGTITQLFETIDGESGFGDPLAARTTTTTVDGRVLHSEQTLARTRNPGTGAITSESRTYTLRGTAATRTATSQYDIATRTLTSVTGTLLETETVHDTAGRAIQVRAPGLAPVDMAYDARGRIISVRQVSALGYGTREVSYDYDEPDGQEHWTPYAIRSGSARTLHSYDDLRRPTSSVTTPVSCLTNGDCDDGVASNGAETCVATECVAGIATVDTLGWDQTDRLTTVRPLARGAHALSYDDADRSAGYTPPVLAGQPSGAVEAFRDADGLLGRVDFNAETLRSIVANRLPDGRPSSIQLEGRTLTFAYDPATRALSSVTTSDGITLQIEQDGPLLESVTWSGSAGVNGSVAFGYGDLWDLESITAGGVTTSYHYDADGAIDCLAPGVVADATCTSGLRITPNVLGRSLATTFGSTSSTYEWSDLGEPTSTVHTWTGGELRFSYQQRDLDGRLTRVIEERDGATYVTEYDYDRRGRLEQVTRDGVVSESYTYDPNGQRAAASHDGVAVSPIVWDDRDRLLQYGAVTFTYDAIGRRQTRTEGGQTTTYTYDLGGALRAVDLPGTASDVEYVIDGAGRRVGRKVGGVLEQTWLYLDALRPVVEMNGAGQVTRVFVYGAARVPEMVIIPAGQPGAGSYRIFTDHLGSVRRVVDTASGATAQAMTYDAFGNVESDTNPGFQPFGYAGGLYDASTGLVRFGARDYDPEIGQWTARDPILFAGGDENLYNYVGAAPVDATDPTGLAWTDTCRAHPVVCGIAMQAATYGMRVVDRAREVLQRATPSTSRVCALADRALVSVRQSLQTIAPSPSSSGLGRLQSIGPSTWQSSGGLVYGPDKQFGNRVVHVLAHLSPNSNKALHSVFNVARSRLLGLIDHAWSRRGAPEVGDPGAFVVSMGRQIGTAGETAVRIVVRPGTNHILTAYPVFE